MSLLALFSLAARGARRVVGLVIAVLIEHVPRLGGDDHLLERQCDDADDDQKHRQGVDAC